MSTPMSSLKTILLSYTSTRTPQLQLSTRRPRPLRRLKLARRRRRSRRLSRLLLEVQEDLPLHNQQVVLHLPPALPPSLAMSLHQIWSNPPSKPLARSSKTTWLRKRRRLPPQLPPRLHNRKPRRPKTRLPRSSRLFRMR